MSLDLSNLYAGFTRSARYSPVERKTLQKGLKRYKLDLSTAAGKSDIQLRRLAAKTVVKKYLAAKRKK